MNNWSDFRISEKYYRPSRDKDGIHFVCVGMTLQNSPLLQSPNSDTAYSPQFFAGTGKRPSDWAVWRKPREPREWCIVFFNGGGKKVWENETEARKYYNNFGEYVTVREVIK